MDKLYKTFIDGPQPNEYFVIIHDGAEWVTCHQEGQEDQGDGFAVVFDGAEWAEALDEEISGLLTKERAVDLGELSPGVNRTNSPFGGTNTQEDKMTTDNHTDQTNYSTGQRLSIMGGSLIQTEWDCGCVRVTDGKTVVWGLGASKLCQGHNEFPPVNHRNVF